MDLHLHVHVQCIVCVRLLFCDLSYKMKLINVHVYSSVNAQHLVDIFFIKLITIAFHFLYNVSLFQDSLEYQEAINPCHQRSADRIVIGALANGGLYVKLGQGLGSFNQVLPREYIDTLKVLQDKVCDTVIFIDSTKQQREQSEQKRLIQYTHEVSIYIP